MNKDTFSAYLKSPQKLDSKSLPDLQEIVKEYPYFQTAQLLLAKNYHNENSIRYDKQLKLAASYASDRVALYKLINNIKDEALIPDDLIGEPVLESLIVEEIEKREPIVPEKKEVQKIEPAKKTVEVTIKPKTEKVEEKKETKVIKVKPQPKKEEFNPSEKHSFLEWLKYSATQPIDATNKETKKAVAKAELPAESKKKEFFSASTMAKKSVEEDESFVTETLAKIYALQGNTEKAIKAYQTLSLKYPEKSSYFAARIKKLEETKD